MPTRQMTRMSLFDEMKLALLTNSEMEEAIFYTALKDQCLTKDGEIKDYLNALSQNSFKKAA